MPIRTETNCALVTFRDVEKTYDGRTLAVRCLNLQVAPGEFLTLLGPSGSGKTTTLNMLAGFERPTRGKILLAGRAVDRLPPYERDIGMVFQNYALFPHMTVADNVAFPLAARKLKKPEIAVRVRRALEMVKLAQYGDRRPGQLSGGQQQRVALARAMVFEPKLVLMDEPLGALDRKLREHMQIEIKQLHERLGLTVVYVTHDQSEALTMSDRVAVFCDGEVVQLGSPDALYRAPETAFVAGFIGENNLLEGRVAQSAADALTVTLAGGPSIHATPIGNLQQGETVCVAVRPECIHVAGDLNGAAENCVRGQVESRVYLGDHQRLLVRLKDGPVIAAKVAPQLEMATGTCLSLSWSAADCRAFPGGTASDETRTLEWGMT